MNIAEKLSKIIDNMPQVYNAGYVEGQQSGGSGVDINKILDPDNYPISESTKTTVDFVMEPGSLDATTGADVEASDLIRSNFVSISSNSGTIYASVEWDKNLRILGYDENKACVKKIYASAGKKFSIPETWAYLRFYTNPTDAQFTFVYGTPETKAEFKKIYIRDHGYYLKGENIEGSDSHKFVIQASGLDGNAYNITEVRAPSSDPKEATLCLTNWGNGVSQMVDISSMVYDPDNPTVEIVCQTRGGKKLPEFSIRYNKGEGGRVKKFTVHPDAIPIELTKDGLKVRKNNKDDNKGTEEEFVTINLADLVENCLMQSDKEEFIKDVNSNFSNALKGNKSGEVVVLTDVSHVPHELKVNVTPESNEWDTDIATPFYYIDDSSLYDMSFVKQPIILSDENGDYEYVLEGIPLLKYNNELVDRSGGTYIYLSDDYLSLFIYETDMANTEPGFITANSLYEMPVDLSNVEHSAYGQGTDICGNWELIKEHFVTKLKEDITLKQYGLNLLGGELRDCIYDQGKTPEWNFNAFESNPIRSAVFQSLKVYLPAGTYTINSSVAINIVRRIINDDKQIAYSKLNTNNDVFTVNYPQYVGFTFRRNDEKVWGETDKIWISVGTTPTEYEPYKEPVIYTPNADGTVSGIVGDGENMTLTTNTGDAVIDVEYNIDINNAFDNIECLSAYGVAVKNGFKGTEQEWLISLNGKDGHTPQKGTDYFTEADKQEMVNSVIASLPKYNGEVVEE